MPGFNEAQRLLLKAHIQGDGTLLAMYTSGNYDLLSQSLNANAVPDFWVYKLKLEYSEVFAAMNFVDVGGLTTANTNRLNAISLGGVMIDPARSDVRAFFEDVFSSTTITKAAIGNAGTFWRRLARRAEKVLATGTGSTASPGILGWQGIIDVGEIGGIMS